MKTCRTHFAVFFTALLLGLAGQLSAAGVQLPGALASFDVRYPNSLPNDFEIYLYGDGLATNDVVGTHNNPHWGPANSLTASVNNDPTSPAFGLNCITIRWVGPPLPAQVGQMRTFGVRLRIGTAVAHSELWWTINGFRIQQPEAAQVIWHATKNGWLIEINNANTVPIYVYGARYFAPATNSSLPTLAQLTTAVNPATFGAAGWTTLALPGGVQVFEIPARAYIFLRVSSVPLRPVVFQIAGRNVSAATLPLPGGTTGPNPNDFNGTDGTMTIQTTRAAQEFSEDLTGDGAVGTPDFNQLRLRFGTTSQDQ